MLSQLIDYSRNSIEIIPSTLRPRTVSELGMEFPVSCVLGKDSAADCGIIFSKERILKAAR